MLKDYLQKDLKVYLVVEDKELVIESVDQSETIVDIKHLIELKTGIPQPYQCIYFEKLKVPLGYEYGEPIKIENDLIEGTPVGQLIDRGASSIGPQISGNRLCVINFREYLTEVLDMSWFYSLDEVEIGEFHSVFTSRYWPFLTKVGLQLIQKGIWTTPSLAPVQTSVRNIFTIRIADIQKVHGFSWTYPVATSKKIISKFDRSQNLMYIFDQFKLTPKYYVAIIKINEAQKYKRYIVGNKLAELVNRAPKNTGILINDGEVFIRQDGTIIHEDNDILSIVEGKLLGQKTRTAYTFNVAIPFALSNKLMSKMITSYSSYIERDYKNINFEQFISFYYKKIDTTGDTLDYTQNGAYIKITGKTVLSVFVNKIKTEEEIENIFNFIIRFVYVYIKDYGLEITPSQHYDNQFKSNTKDIDWKLFSRENLFDSKHTRLCQKEKQPYGFFLDSSQYQFFKDNPKNAEMIENQVVMDNLTYPDKKSVYVCPSKRYKYPTFISSLINKKGICIPCCSSINKNKSPEFQKCIGSDKSEVRESNNLYYISQFNPEKIMKKKRLSYLPEIFHRLLNTGVKLKNFIAPGEEFYILLGKENSSGSLSLLIEELTGIRHEEGSVYDFYLKRGINIFTINLTGELDENGNDTHNPKYSIINTYDTLSMINNLNANRTIFLVRTRDYINYPILHISLSKTRKYDLTILHEASSRISQTMTNLLSKGLKQSTDIKFENYKQIKGSLEYICTSIYVNNVVLPIKPRPFTKTHEIVPEFEHTNRFDDVMKLGLVINYDLIHGDKFIGVETGDGLYVFFEPVGINKSYGNRKEFHIDLDSLKVDVTNEQLPVDVGPELYQVFVLTYSKLLNEVFLPHQRSNEEWGKLLLKKYNGKSTPEFVLDYNNIVAGNFDKIEAFKDRKKNPGVREIMSEHVNIIRVPSDKYSTSNIRKTCDLVGPYSIHGQCSGDKLNLTEKQYKLYCNVLEWELKNNPYMKGLVFSGNLPVVVDYGNFSHQEGTRVIHL